MKTRKFECFEDKLAYQLKHSQAPAHKDVLLDMIQSFPTHMNRLELGVERMDDVVADGIVPDDAGYPRRFTDAYSEHSQAALRFAEGLANGTGFDETKFLQYLSAAWLEPFLDYLDVDTSDPGHRDDIVQVRQEIPSYAIYQLVCFLTQVKQEVVDKRSQLYEVMQKPDSARVINAGLARRAKFTPQVFFSAITLLERGHIAHDNRAAILSMLMFDGKRSLPLDVAEDQLRHTIASLCVTGGPDSIVPGYEDDARVALN